MRYSGRVAVLFLLPLFLIAQSPPAGDNCNNAFVIETLDTAVTYVGNTQGFTNDINSITCGVSLNAGGPDVIYSYYRPEGDTSCVVLYVSIPQDTWDIVLYVFKGDCDNPVCIAGSDQFGPGSPEAFFFELEPGVVHYITIDGKTSDDYGPYVMSISSCPTEIEEKTEISLNEAISVYPTIVRNSFTVNFDVIPTISLDVSLYDVTGRKVCELYRGLAFSRRTFELPENLASGLYILNIRGKDLNVTRQFIVTK